MSIAVLSARFTAPADATIRFTRSGSVDWSISEGDTWDCIYDLVAEWSSVVSAAALGSIALAVDEDAHTLTVVPSGSGWSITWSQSGDGTAIRDALGATGSTTTTAFPSHVPCAYVARYGAVRAHRESTGVQRGHRVTVDGSQQTQHNWAPSDTGDIPISVQLWTGIPSGTNTYATHERLAEYVDSIWDVTGHSEPVSLDLAGIDDDLSDTDRWLLRFIEDRLQIRPARVDGSQMDRLWSVAMPAMRAESTPW